MHNSCLSPPPEKKPMVWDCDDCLIARRRPPTNNYKKRVNAVGLYGPGPPVLTTSTSTEAPTLSRYSDLMPPALTPKDKGNSATDDTRDSEDSSSSSSGSESDSDSEGPALAPPKLAPAASSDFNSLFEADGKKPPVENLEVKDVASVEYSSNNSEDEKKEDEPLKRPKKDKVVKTASSSKKVVKKSRFGKKSEESSTGNF